MSIKISRPFFSRPPFPFKFHYCFNIHFWHTSLHICPANYSEATRFSFSYNSRHFPTEYIQFLRMKTAKQRRSLGFYAKSNTRWEFRQSWMRKKEIARRGTTTAARTTTPTYRFHNSRRSINYFHETLTLKFSPAVSSRSLPDATRHEGVSSTVWDDVSNGLHISCFDHRSLRCSKWEKSDSVFLTRRLPFAGADISKFKWNSTSRLRRST